MSAIKPNQKDRIADYMRHFGSITPLDAFYDLGVTKLATRISEMKREGYLIGKTTESHKNRYGESVSYARYFFLKREEF